MVKTYRERKAEELKEKQRRERIRRTIIQLSLVFLGCICLIALFYLITGGFKKGPGKERPVQRVASKINLGVFVTNTDSYKGKLLTLRLESDTPLRDQAGHDVTFKSAAKGHEDLHLVITFPSDLKLPDVGSEEAVFVTFECTEGSLKKGNIARVVAKPTGHEAD